MAAAKKSPALAVAVFGSKSKGGDKPPEDDAADVDDEDTGSAEAEEAAVLFDDALPIEERQAALKEFIRLCTKGGY